MLLYAAMLLTLSIIAIMFVIRNLISKNTSSIIGSIVISAILIWSLGLTLEISSSDFSTKLLWNKIQFIGIDLLPSTWLIYVLYLLGYGRWLTRRLVCLLSIAPAVKLLLVFTNEMHGLIYEQVSLNPYDPRLPLTVHYGLGFWVFFIYIYALLLYSSVFSLATLFRAYTLYKSQAAALLLITVVPWVSSAFVYLRLRVFPMDFTPAICLVASILLSLVNPSRLRLKDVIPVAHKVVLNSISDGIIVMDEHNNILELNKAAEAMTGLSNKDARGRAASEILSFIPNPSSSELCNDSGREVSLGGKTYSLHFSTVSDWSGNPRCRILVLHDVTRMKLMEEELKKYTEHLESLVKEKTKKLQESQSWLTNVFTASPDAILVADIKGNIVECNHATLTMFKFPSRNDAIGKNGLNFVAKKDHRKLSEISKVLLKEGLVRNIEITLLTADGKEFAGEVSLSLIRDLENNPAYIIAMARDITDRKEMQKKLLRSERLAAIGELAGMVGHDLRNPLTSILGASYYLKMKYNSILDEKSRYMLKIIEDDVRYANKIVDDLLDYSSEIRLNLKVVNLASLISESLRILEIPNNIEVVKLVDEGVKLEVDIEKMKRVFVNIIRNAVEAMPVGGKLTIQAVKFDDRVEVTFTDTGIGIPKEMLPNLGKPLFTTKPRGMGFGLAVSKRFVEAHNGTISWESTYGKGTTVRIILPLSRQETDHSG
ncbi:MAG: histidine kinase N-terminal 7TM domain-containing protein [Nitrososphaerota archaeon]|nr:PAS domain S-box protein [Candidatus Bathyarchaeota archaeon]MDW8048904.1 histidine kinase N-terminal 7TM domain-containing protein [Nitrososphaerota archaeon]